MDLLVANLRVDVIGYKASQMDKNVIFYIIEVEKRGHEKWTVDKRFSEFYELNKQLKKLFQEIPELPNKTFFKLKDEDSLFKRKIQLDQFLKLLVVRQDVYNSEAFKKFLQIENFAPETVVNPPKQTDQITNFAHGVRDFHYQREKFLLFALISDMNVSSRVDSYLTNMKLPWEKQGPQVIISVGAIECYVQLDQNEFKFERLWTKIFPVQAICMHWDQPSCQLAIGLDNGTVVCLKVSSELNYIKHIELINNKVHDWRVMSIQIENVNNYIYSVSSDKNFVIQDISRNQLVQVINVNGFPLTGIIIDKEFKRAFISTEIGTVHIFDISKNKTSYINKVSTVGKGKIRGMKFDSVKNYLFTGGYADGEICIFDIDKPGKEKFAKISCSLNGKSLIRCIQWSRQRQEIYVGHEDGTLVFWNARKGQPIYVLKAHEKAINKLVWLEDQQTLVSGSKDKTIKLWQLPEEWRDRKIEEEEQREYKIRQQTENLIKFRQQQQRAQDDSDEDDLQGWQKN